MATGSMRGVGVPGMNAVPTFSRCLPSQMKYLVPALNQGAGLLDCCHRHLLQ